MLAVCSAAAQDADAFEFRRAWRQKVQRIRQARTNVGPALGPSYSSGQLASQGAALTGTLSIPVINALFSDYSAPYTQAEYQERLFGSGSGTVSLSEYWDEVSGSAFQVTGLVSDWAPLPMPVSYYEPSDSTNYKFGRSFEFIHDALTAADPGMDFAPFDNDGPDGIPNSGDDDGYVDVVAFIYPERTLGCGGRGIWGHRSRYDNHSGSGGQPFVTDDPSALGGYILISDYTLQSGLDCRSTAIMGTGTMAHELGHALRLPDLYDRSPYDGTESEGIGVWGLMGSGNYNVLTSPAHLSAWSKDYLGWLNVVSTSVSVPAFSLQPVQNARTVMRIDIPGSNEYFLLSNRQVIGSDAALRGPGLLIWHIDEVQLAANGNNDENHKGVDLEEADGLYDLDNRVNRGDTGDPYPGSSWNTRFDHFSNPNSFTYDGRPSGVAVTNILAIGDVIHFDVSVGEDVLVLWGDVDGDSTITTADVQLIYDFAVGFIGDTTGLLGLGDVDDDGDVDVTDGLITHSFIAGVATWQYRVGSWDLVSGVPRPTSMHTGPGRTRIGPAGRRVRIR
jgi:M6 family metalloprotease-like protein